MHALRPTLRSFFFILSILYCLAARPADAAAQSAPPADLASLIPGDALVAINIPDAPALLQKWNASPFARFYDDPRAAGFFRPVRDQFAGLQRRLGVAPERLARFFSGQVVLAGVAGSARSNGSLEWVLVARHNGDPQILERLKRPPAPPGATLRRIPEQVSGGELIRFEILRTEAADIPAPKPKRNKKQDRPTLTAEDLGMIQGGSSGGGEPLLKRQVSEEYEAFFGPGLIIWAGSKGHPLQKMLARLGGEGSGGFAKKADLQKGSGALGRGDITILANAGALAQSALREGAGASTLFNPAGLALDELRAAGAAITLEPARLALQAAVLAPPPRRGASRILFLPQGPAPDVARLLPLSAAGYSAISIPLPQLWSTLMELMRFTSPTAFSLVQTQLQAFEQASGASVQQSLVDQLGGALASFDLPQEGARNPGERATLMVALRDGAQFRDALRALLNYSSFLGGFHLEIDRDGRWPVWTLAEGAAGVASGGRAIYHLCVTDHWLLAGSRREGIDAVRKRLENPAGPSLQDNRNIQAIAGKLPAERFATGVMESGGLQSLAQALLGPLPMENALGKKSKGAKNVGDLELLNAGRMPEARVWSQYFGPAAFSLSRAGEALVRFQGFYAYAGGQ